MTPRAEERRRGDVYFGPFRLDLEGERLWQGAAAIDLRPKSFAVLRYLTAHPGRLITKDELLQAGWPGIIVSESVLAVCLSEIRRALGDDPRAPRLVETVPRRGYRFIATISRPTPGVSAAALDPRPLPPAPPVVGRQGELAQLHRWWEDVRRGERRIAFVSGEPGIGKTTVVDAFVAQAAARGEAWSGRGQCIEHYGAGEAYLPVLDALARLCRDSEGEPIRPLLHRYAPTWLAQMPWLLDGPDLEALQRRILGATRERMLRELAEVVEALSQARPLLLVLEDLHWSDGATVDLLAWLARRRETARLLLIGTYRPVDAILGGHPLRAVVQELRRQRGCVELAVELLTAADVAQYLSARFPVPVPPGAPLRELATVIHRRTDGHPLFMVTLVDYLTQRGWLGAVEGQWQVESAVAGVERELPDSLRQMLEQQLEGLRDDDRRLLEAASVAGVEMSAAAVAAGLAGSLTAAEERCAALARQRRFLQASGVEQWPDGTVAGRYRFRHGLYQQVAYEAMPEGRRIELHRRIGRRLAQGYGGQPGERATELAGHCERGRDYRPAVRYRRQAGENALQRCAYREAADHLTTALTSLARLPETPERIRDEVALLTTLGPALIATKGHAAPEVERAYVRARELCREMQETPHLFRVLRGLSMLYLNRAELQQVRALAEQRLSLAQRERDPALLLGAHDALGAILYHRGEFASARIHLEQGIMLSHTQRRHGRAIQDAATDHGVACLGHLAWVLWFLGAPEHARRRSREGIALAQELAHPFSLVQALYWGAQLHQFCRDARAAQERAQAAIAVATAQGFAQQQAQGLLLHGWALVQQGRRDEGIAQMRQGLDGWEATGAQLLRPYYLALLAEAYGQGGQADEGLRLLSEALASAHNTGERSYEAELYRLQAELWLACDAEQHGAAEVCFRQALDVARGQQARSLELRAATSLARLWQRQGKHAEARRLLAEVHGWFAEEGDTADLLEAKGLLVELS